MIDESLRARTAVPIDGDARIKRLYLIKLWRNDDCPSTVDETPLSAIDDGAPSIHPHTESHGSHSFRKLLNALETWFNEDRTIFSNESPLATKEESNLSLLSSSRILPNSSKTFRKILDL